MLPAERLKKTSGKAIIMKITKQQLKQIIKEELHKNSLQEFGDPLEPIYDALREIGRGLDSLQKRIEELERKRYETN